MTSHTMLKVVGSWTLAEALSISVATAQNGNSSGVTDNEIRNRQHYDVQRAGFRQTGSELEGAFRSEMMLLGITANTSQSDFFPFQQMQLMQFDGSTWRLFGEVIDLSTERRQ